MAKIVPSRTEWQKLFDLLTKKERIAFLVLFAAAWISGTLLLVIVDKNYSKPVPIQDGAIVEGVVGMPRFINPLLSITDADRDVSRIVYAGLIKPDGKGGFMRQLASDYEISEDGLTYTFHLRKNLKWHDGEPITAADVVFTIELAKNPDIMSPKRANWEGVDIAALDAGTVEFRLNRPYAPFLENATLGILPRHIWSKVHPDEFSFSKYNLEPVGSGPFKFKSSVTNSSGSITSITLARFGDYKPKPAYLDKITFKFYPSENELAKSYSNKDIGLANISNSDLAEIPENATEIKIKSPRVFAVFFNQDEFTPLQSAALRSALTYAVDRKKIINDAAMGNGIATSLPIPSGTLGNAQDLENLGQDLEKAREILKSAGFEDTDGDGIIEKVEKKNSTPVAFKLTTSNAPELVRSAELISGMWKEIGVSAEVEPFELGDLENIIRARNYQALLFGQVLGYDPDPFAFWHASQRKDPGLNVAQYANTSVDSILDKARATIDRESRFKLYHEFQKKIMEDKPAVFLYSPLYTYAIPGNLHGVQLANIPLPHERFSQIETWYISTKNVWNILL